MSPTPDKHEKAADQQDRKNHTGSGERQAHASIRQRGITNL
jgi:hypothetical protein